MPLHYENLDDRTRGLMIYEVDGDVAASKLYRSVRFSPKGMAAYEGLLRLAIEKHSDSWLADQLRNGCMKTHEMRKKPKGGVTTALVPVTAADTFAEGEFNRFYARAVCSRAIADGIPHVVVYRGKEVVTPRPESTALIGTKFTPTGLLFDLRSSQGVEPGLGLPPGPNSGLTIKLL